MVGSAARVHAKILTKRNLERDLERAEHVIRVLIARHYGNWPIPPEDLRLHVGARSSMANFWAQGMNSSQRVVEIFGEEPRGRILDWGCGPGRTLLWLKAYPAWRDRYYGCDVDAEAIAWLKEQGQTTVTICNERPPLPYPNAFFDGLFAFSVLTHIPPKRHREWYSELHRVLSPGGRAYVTNHGVSIAHQSMVSRSVTGEFDRQGWAWLEAKGHYKSASMVSETFTRNALEGLFTVEYFQEEGYQNHDAYLLYRPV
jgi:SAM-dependent methyltransferase